MEDQKPIRFQCEFSVRLPVVIAELDLIGPIQEFHHRSDLAANQTVLGQVRQERNDIEQLRFPMHGSELYLT
jgi:hypothetical protein